MPFLALGHVSVPPVSELQVSSTVPRAGRAEAVWFPCKVVAQPWSIEAGSVFPSLCLTLCVEMFACWLL